MVSDLCSATGVVAVVASVFLATSCTPLRNSKNAPRPNTTATPIPIPSNIGRLPPLDFCAFDFDRYRGLDGISSSSSPLTELKDSSSAPGTTTASWHLGQRTLRPAASSVTLNFRPLSLSTDIGTMVFPIWSDQSGRFNPVIYNRFMPKRLHVIEERPAIQNMSTETRLP